mmetsp:Transcript_17207/g.34477  ORF Transcript_17207/g.34477 Transcript_17207/m.34477 type:complete len:315 (-) Transcript_17207:75-1019(-)
MGIGEVILTGLGMGVVHVLSGPDHLSALATLSAAKGYKSFILGVRWGVGHSTGLLLVALILLVGNNEGFKMSEDVTTVLDEMVGVFMILLGFHGIYRAIKNDTDNYQDLGGLVTDDDFDCNLSDDEHEMTDLLKSPTSPDDAFDGDFDGDFNGGDLDDDDIEVGETGVRGKVGGAEKEILQSQHSHPHDHGGSLLLWCRTWGCPNASNNPYLGKSVAFGVGVVHGIAGPGGILGVIPAVHMGGLSAFAYLTSFCGMSIVVMAAFAATYGEFSERLANTARLKMMINIISASLSITVGLLWCVLSYYGILDQYFD